MSAEIPRQRAVGNGSLKRMQEQTCFRLHRALLSVSAELQSRALQSHRECPLHRAQVPADNFLLLATGE
jgi:hypothetical protein